MEQLKVKNLKPGDEFNLPFPGTAQKIKKVKVLDVKPNEISIWGKGVIRVKVLDEDPGRRPITFSFKQIELLLNGIYYEEIQKLDGQKKIKSKRKKKAKIRRKLFENLR